jgi:hypothetical protein
LAVVVSMRVGKPPKLDVPSSLMRLLVAVHPSMTLLPAVPVLKFVF